MNATFTPGSKGHRPTRRRFERSLLWRIKGGIKGILTLRLRPLPHCPAPSGGEAAEAGPLRSPLPPRRVQNVPLTDLLNHNHHCNWPPLTS